MQLFVYETLDALRRSINAATGNLAATGMQDEQATIFLAWTLQAAASQAFVALQHQSEQQSIQNEDDSTESEHDECLIVKALKLEGTISQEKNPLVFSHPFVIAPVSEDTAISPESYLNGTCAVTWFNLALARHIQSFAASLKPEEQEDLLQQAEEYYTKACDLLDECSSSLSPDSTLFAVYLALCNNQAELFTHFGDMAQAKSWQETLRLCLDPITPEPSDMYWHFSNANLAYAMELRTLP